MQNGAPVTVLGLGPMGRSLAGAFAGAGHPVTVWNRTPGKAEDLLGRGVTEAPTAAEAVAASPLVIICVLDYEAVHAVLDPVAESGRLAGRTLVNLTADTPARARETAAWAGRHGFGYLDGAIMTPTTTIGGPEAVVIYSGPEALYAEHRPVLAAIGGSGSHLGTEPGRAASFDIALLDIFWTAMSGYVHALALARAEGVPARELLPFAQGIGAILPPIMAELAEQTDAGRYPGDGSSIVSAAAGMEHIIRAARARGIDSSALAAAKAVADRAVDAGHGGDGFSRLAEVLGAEAHRG